MTTPRPHRRFTGLAVLAASVALVASACGDDGTPSTSSTEPEAPEALTENASETTRVPNLVGMTFINNTGVDFDLELNARRTNGTDEFDTTQPIEFRDNSKWAAVLVNPTGNTMFGFTLKRDDWIGMSNTYSFFPSDSDNPDNQCSSLPVTFLSEGASAADRGWTVEFTNPNAQGYHGTLSRPGFTCHFNMYTDTQRFFHDIDSSEWSRLLTRWNDAEMLPVFPIEPGAETRLEYSDPYAEYQIIGFTWDTWRNTAEAIPNDSPIQFVDALVIPLETRDDEWIESRRPLVARSIFRETDAIGSTVVIQELGSDITPENYWDMVSKDVGTSDRPINLGTLLTRSQLAVLGIQF